MPYISGSIVQNITISSTPPGGATYAVLGIAWRDGTTNREISGTTLAWGTGGLFTQVQVIASPNAPSTGADGGGSRLASYIALAANFPTSGNTVSPSWTPGAPLAANTEMGITYYDDAFSLVGATGQSIAAPSGGVHEFNIATATGNRILIFFNGGNNRGVGTFTGSDPVPTSRITQNSGTNARNSLQMLDATANDASAFVENSLAISSVQFLSAFVLGPASFPPELTGQLITVEGGIDYANSDRGLLDGVEYVPTSDTAKTQYGALEVGQQVKTLISGIPSSEQFPGLDYVQPTEDFGYRAPDGTVYRSP